MQPSADPGMIPHNLIGTAYLAQGLIKPEYPGLVGFVQVDHHRLACFLILSPENAVVPRYVNELDRTL